MPAPIVATALTTTRLASPPKPARPEPATLSAITADDALIEGAARDYGAGMQPLALFDLDDTLIDRRAAFNAWAEEFAAVHHLDDKALAFMLTADAHHSGPMDSFFAKICETLGLAEAPNLLWEQYRRRMPELASCRSEDLDALRRMRQTGWRVGIVTNGMTDNQLGKIRNTGLSDVVDAWGISDELGVRKPNPEIFRLVAERCAGNLDRGGWMIGDNLILDIAGGRAAGLRTIWLQPQRRPQPWSFVEPAPDFTVDSVADAVEVLLREQRTQPLPPLVEAATHRLRVCPGGWALARPG
jgi:HAD superfamily hydrolase (TIGR01549 family)